MRDRAGVIVIAGKTPYGEDPDSPGGRSHTIHWQQDVPDQAGIVRGYAKWVMEITRADMLPRAIGRAVQVATGGRPGAAYLMVSRDVLMDPPARDLGRTSGYAVARPPAADAETVRWIAERLTAAERPLLVTSKVGRRPEGFDAVTRLADLAGIRVIDTAESGCVNIASSHPMSVRSAAEAQRLVRDADVILVVDCDVPWIPKFTRPGDDATIIHLDADPLKTDMPLWTFPVDLAVTADGATALGQLVRHLEELGGETPEHPPVARTAPTAEPEGPITAHEAVEALNSLLRQDDIVVEEAVTSAGALHQALERSLPGTLYGTGSPGLGWGLGGAVGVSLASPGRRVVAVVGDGSFMFGVPTAALCLAAEVDAPILAVVLNNDGYRASRLPVFELFPEGLSAARGDAVGTRFSQPPDFAAVARACHADGERVRERAELIPALRRGLQAIDSGRSAVVDVHITRN
jgi:acetolactate synthase-1/2/3 large subunit